MSKGFSTREITKILGASDFRDQRFAIFIPEKDRDGKYVPQREWLERAVVLLTDICGGATAMPPDMGAWRNKKRQQTIVEKPILVYAYIDPKPFRNRLGEIVEFLHEMGKETNQGQVAVEFNESLYLIDFDEAHST